MGVQSTLRIRCLRHEAELTCRDPAVAQRVSALLGTWVVDEVGPCAAEASIIVEPTSAGPWFHLRVGGLVEYVGPGLEGCLDRLVWRITQDAIAADERVLVHAACVADARGIAMLLVGPSGSGKTTLSVALARHGLRMLSDEVGVIDPADLRVWPFLRPPGFEPDAARLFPDLGLGEPGGWSRHVPFTAVAGSAGDESPAEIGVIVVPDYDADAATCELTELDKAATLLALAQATPRLGELGQHALERLAALADGVPGYRLRSGPIDHATTMVGELLERTAPGRHQPRSVRQRRGPTRRTGEPGAPRHAAGSMSVNVGDGAVVVAGDGSTMLLNRTAALCWWAVSGWCTVADVVVEVSAQLGIDPAMIANDVAALIEDLESAGLIVPFGEERVAEASDGSVPSPEAEQ